jgi:hypothetical protein
VLLTSCSFQTVHNTRQSVGAGRNTALAQQEVGLTDRHSTASLGPQGEAPKSCKGETASSSNRRRHAIPDAGADWGGSKDKVRSFAGEIMGGVSDCSILDGPSNAGVPVSVLAAEGSSPMRPPKSRNSGSFPICSFPTRNLHFGSPVEAFRLNTKRVLTLPSNWKHWPLSSQSVDLLEVPGRSGMMILAPPSGRNLSCPAPKSLNESTSERHFSAVSDRLRKRFVSLSLLSAALSVSLRQDSCRAPDDSADKFLAQPVLVNA